MRLRWWRLQSTMVGNYRARECVNAQSSLMCFCAHAWYVYTHCVYTSLLQKYPTNIMTLLTCKCIPPSTPTLIPHRFPLWPWRQFHPPPPSPPVPLKEAGKSFAVVIRNLEATEVKTWLPAHPNKLALDIVHYVIHQKSRYVTPAC